MKNYILLFSVILILVICNILLIYSNYKYNHTDDLKDINASIEYNDDKIVSINNRIIFQIEHEGVVLDSTIRVWLNDDEMYLKNLIKRDEREKLVLVYSEINCHTCVDHQIGLLKELAKDIGDEHILILASYQRQNDLIRFKRLNHLKDINVVRIKTLNLSIEQLNTPFLFILNHEMKLQSVFIPDSEYPETSKKYYEYVRARLQHSMKP